LQKLSHIKFYALGGSMGKIISEAGEVTFEVKGVRQEGCEIVILGKMGVWNAEVFLSAEEIIRILPSRAVLSMIITLPLTVLKKWLRGSRIKGD
jgi:hypothetical protein